MKCDFHTHSTVSDGSFAPDALVEHAAEAGITVMALSDHDDVSGVAPARQAGERCGVELIAAVELTVSEDGGRRGMHVLGYGVDSEDPDFLETLAERRGARGRRLRRMLDQLRAAGVELDADALEHETEGGAVGRPHVARALVDAGAVPDMEAAFARYLRRGRPGYVPHEDWPAERAIRLIHDARGVAVLAHPPLSAGADGPGGLESFVGGLARQGLDGLEVWHPGHTPSQTKRLSRFARELGLLQTGGSDFHGAAKPDIRIAHGRGNIRIGAAVHRALAAAIASRSRAAELGS